MRSNRGLGALPPKQRAAPEGADVIDETPEEDVEFQAEIARLTQLTAEVRSLDKSDPAYPGKLLELTQLAEAIGGEPILPDDQLGNLKQNAQDQQGLKALWARHALSSDLDWAEQNLEGTDRSFAIAHAFSTHAGDLDPIQDREAIDTANQISQMLNPTKDTE